MIGAIFKIAGMIINTGTNIVASGAVITSTALLSAKKLDDDENQCIECKKDMKRKLKNISGRYKIVDTENDLEILTSTDNYTEARAWLCEYRASGYKVMLQTK